MQHQRVMLASSAPKEDLSLWHRRLRHRNKRGILTAVVTHRIYVYIFNSTLSSNVGIAHMAITSSYYSRGHGFESDLRHNTCISNFTGRGNCMYKMVEKIRTTPFEASSSDMLGGGWPQKPVWAGVEGGGKKGQCDI